LGKLVTIQESEHQIITAHEVHARRPLDVTFDRPPEIADGESGQTVERRHVALVMRVSAAASASESG
jgi:hypothetical protein